MKSLTLITGPTNEPVTLDEAKNWLRLDGSDNDAQLQSLITAARTSAEQFTRRSFLSQTWKLSLDLCGTNLLDRLGDGVYDLPVTALYGGLPQRIDLPCGPVQSITSVTTYDLDNAGTVYASSNYYLADDRLVLTYGATWPSNLRPQHSAEILFVTGYGDGSTNVPGPIKTAILIMVATLFEQRGQCDDSADLPAGAKQLLNQYRRMTRG